MIEYKQVILVRDDLKLPKGKLAAQVGHAAVEGVFVAPKSLVRKWRLQGMKKVVVGVPSRAALIKIVDAASAAGLPTAVVYDAGRTVVRAGTLTCAVLGPAASAKLDAFTGSLKIVV